MGLLTSADGVVRIVWFERIHGLLMILYSVYHPPLSTPEKSRYIQATCLDPKVRIKEPL